jgi:alpha-tubulin suppressor-like RCC1 family protein
LPHVKASTCVSADTRYNHDRTIAFLKAGHYMNAGPPKMPGREGYTFPSGRFALRYSISALILRAVAVAFLWALCARAQTAQVVAWGDNSYGQTDVPPGLTNVVAVAAGGGHSLALQYDGTVVAWGKNDAGQTNIPLGLSNVVAVVSGTDHNVALRADGRVVAWGFDVAGQTDVPAGLSNVVAVAAGGGWRSLALKSDGELVGWGSMNPPLGLSNVVSMGCGIWHNLALKSDGTVVAWGAGDHGNDIPNGLSDVVSIAAGYLHSLALKLDGTVVAWGKNDSGQTNVPAGLTNVVAVAAGGLYSLALKSDGTVVAWGSDSAGQTQLPTDLGRVAALAAGEQHCLVLANDGLPFIQTQLPRRVIPAGGASTLRIQAVGAWPLCYQWRLNGSEIGGATNALLNLTNFGSSQVGAYTVVVSNRFGAAISTPVQVDIVPFLLVGQPEDQNVWAAQTASFGVNVQSPLPLAYQWLFNGSALPGETNSSLTLVDVSPSAAGGYSVSVNNWFGSVTSREARLTVNQLALWGQNTPQQLSVGQANVVAIAAADHIVVLKSDGTVVAWGPNDHGQTNVPAGLSNVVAVAAGAANSLALKADGTAVSWGGDSVVPAGLPALVGIAAGPGSLGLTAGGDVVGWDAFGQPLVEPFAPPPNLRGVVAIAAGERHFLALKADGTIVAWGGYGDQPGLTNVPAGLSNAVAVVGQATHSLALRADGSLSAWGFDGFAAGPIPQFSDVTGIATASFVGLALKSDGTIETWPSEMPFDLHGVVAVAAGPRQSVALVGYGPPFIRTRFARQQRPVGSTAILRVEASGSWPLHYQWRLNEVEIPGATNALLALTNLTTTQAGTYTVLVSNRFGTATSTGALVDVVGLIITSPPRARTVLSGTEVSLVVTCESTLPLSYQWRRNGVELPGATNSTLTFRPAALHDTGTYSVVVNSSLESAVSAKAVLTVLPIAAWGTDLLLMTGNEYGQCDLPAGLSNVVAAAAGQAHSVALLADGQVAAWGGNAYGQTNVPMGLQKAIGIAAGGWHTLALKTDGTVIAWGRNDYGQCNVPASLKNVVKLAGGGWHSLALNADGTVETWGYGGNGLANIPTGLNNVVSVAAGAGHSVALKADGSVMAWGNNEYGQTTPPVVNAEIVEVAAGYFHNLALKTDDTVLAWSAGLGVPAGFPEGGASRIAQGGFNNLGVRMGRSLVLGKDGRVAAWWVSADGPGGRGDDSKLPLWLERVGGVACGWYHALAVPWEGAPFLLSQPTDRTVGGPLDTTFFRADVHGTPPLLYQWRRNGTDLPGATNALLRLTGITSAQTGKYSVAVSNALGGVVSRGALLGLAQTPLQLALDNDLQPPTTGGSAPWFGQTLQTHDGEDAAQSGGISHDQQSWLEQAVTGPGTLSYWWKVSSEVDYDFLEFRIDGVLQSGRISGEVSWQRREFRIPAGTHTLRWLYVKDPSDSAGADAGWLDQVAFVPDVAVFITDPRLVASGSTFELTVQAGQNRAYWLEYATTLPTLDWRLAVGRTNVVGPLILSDPNPTNRQRFYRVGTAPAF